MEFTFFAEIHQYVFTANILHVYTPQQFELVFSGLHMPISLTKLSRFENLNQICANVLGSEGGEDVFPLQVKTVKSPCPLMLIYGL